MKFASVHSITTRLLFSTRSLSSAPYGQALKRFASDNPNERAEAVTKFGRSSPPAASDTAAQLERANVLPAVLDLLNDPNPVVVAKAAVTVGRLSEAERAPFILGHHVR